MGRSPLSLPAGMSGQQQVPPIEVQITLECEAAVKFLDALVSLADRLRQHDPDDECTANMTALRDRARQVLAVVLCTHGLALAAQQGVLMGLLLELENRALAHAKTLGGAIA